MSIYIIYALTFHKSKSYQTDLTGSYTYCGPNGRSVDDLVLTNSLCLILHFKVNDLTEFLDHSTVDFSIQCTFSDNCPAMNTNDSRTSTAHSISIVRWKEQFELQMRRDLIGRLDALYSCVEEDSDTNQMVDNFSEKISCVL